MNYKVTLLHNTMKNLISNSLLKTATALATIAFLVSCGGSNPESNSNTSASANTGNTELANNDTSDTNTALSEFNALETIAVASPTAADFSASSFINRASTLSATALTSSVAQVADEQIEELIIKYKERQLISDSDLTRNGISTNVSSKATQLTKGAAPSISTLSTGITGVANKHGLNMAFQLATHDDSGVFSIGKSVSAAEAKKIAAEMQAADSNIEYVSLNKRMHRSVTPNDPGFTNGYMWALENSSTYGIKAETAWNYSNGNGVVVAVVDTGYRPHVDMAGRILKGYDFIHNRIVANDGNGRDSNAIDNGDGYPYGFCGYRDSSENSWHGTHVSGTIAANTNNGLGVSGIAYGAKILPVRVLGRCGGYTNDIADAIVWASGGKVSGVPTNKTPAKVINLSLGGDADSYGVCGTLMQRAITKARANGAIVVVAAGNSNENANYSSPANCSDAITVGATSSAGNRASFSNYGDKVDISAPGVDIVSTLNSGAYSVGQDNVYASYNGTSMATPHVAAALALMLSYKPRLRPVDAENIIKQSVNSFAGGSCDNVGSGGCGTGILDASKAVSQLSSTAWRVANDFDGNGRSDVLFKQPIAGETGALLVAYLNKSKYALGSSGLVFDANSKVSAIGDFNGDGRSDILETNASGTITNIRYMAARANFATTPVTGAQPSGSVVQGAADTNGDGLDDVILKNAAGQIIVSLQNGSGAFTYSTVKSLSSTAVYKGAGDFNGDGKADLVFQDSASNVVSVVYMNGAAELGTATIGLAGGQSVVGVGRFYKDSAANLLVKNTAGQVYVGRVSGDSVGLTLIAKLAANVAIAHVGDYDGNGQDDVLWRKTGSKTSGVLSFSGTKVSKINMASLIANLLVQAKP